VEERRDPRRSTTQEDLAAILGNPDALRLLAFGAKTMGRFVETSRTMSRLAFEATGLAPASTSYHGTPTSPRPRSDSQSATSEPAAPTIPDGTMLVPVDAWNRVLDQLGNLHEAGQDLAEARERAARAETTAEFQVERREIAEAERDRLAAELEELRAAARPKPRAERAPAPAEPAPVADNGASSPAAGSTVGRRMRSRLIRILDR
jgi:hypothetical protein